VEGGDKKNSPYENPCAWVDTGPDKERSRLKKILLLQSDTLSICRLDGNAPLPEWALTGKFYSITRTAEELSVVCPQNQVPPGVLKQDGWRALQVEGPLDFSLTGVLASLTEPLAKEGISVFAISTYDTDFLLVKEEQLEAAIQALREEGFEVEKYSR